MEKSKRCFNCGRIKDAKLFYSNKSNVTDGLRGSCKECTKNMSKYRYDILKGGKNVCTKCKIEKDIEHFSVGVAGKQGIRSHCKKCSIEYRRNNYKKNREKICKQTNLYKKNNKEKVDISRKKYADSHKEEAKEYYKKNFKKIAKRKKEYYLKNKKKLDIKRNIAYNKKYAEDPVFNLSVKLSKTIQKVFKQAGISKNKSKINILGCTCKEFKVHLEDNQYNFKTNSKGIDLDHIIPKWKAKTEKEIYKLNHYTNFQLLPSEYNRNIKRDNDWDVIDFEKWMVETNYGEQ